MFNIAFLFLLTPFSIWADDTVSNKTSSIEMIAGFVKPPFIIEENGSGLQLDIIRQALSNKGYQVNFLHLPLGRNITAFQRMNADGVITLPNDYEHPGMHMSAPYIVYQNVAVSLAANGFNIGSVNDLSGKSVAAFQHAKKFLGKQYRDTVSYAVSYREIAEQKKQIEMLFLRQAEVIILDLNIFKHFIKTSNDKRFNKAFNVHYIFDQRHYAAGFRSEKIAKDFDLAVAKMKEDGSYQEILDNYLK